MSGILRTFIGIEIKPSALFLKALASLKEELQEEPIKWIEAEKLHLTLKFIGDTFPSQLEQIDNELNKIAGSFPAFSFQLDGLEFFRDKGTPQVLFVKTENEERVKQLASEIEKQLESLGFEPENRPFKAHLTLARIKFLKNRLRFYEAIEKFQHSFSEPVNVNEFIFYRSILNPTGAEYIFLENYLLQM